MAVHCCLGTAKNGGGILYSTFYQKYPFAVQFVQKINLVLYRKGVGVKIALFQFRSDYIVGAAVRCLLKSVWLFGHFGRHAAFVKTEVCVNQRVRVAKVKHLLAKFAVAAVVKVYAHNTDKVAVYILDKH